MRGRGATLALAGLLLVGGAAGCARLLHNFGTVRQGEIYRSAQPSPLLLRYLVARYGVRSLVNLRGHTPGFESAFAARRGLRLFVLDLSASRPPSRAQVERFLRIVSDPENQPLLVHCRNGVDRSGYMLGVYRVERDGWDEKRALCEMNRFMQWEWMNPLPQRVVREGLRADEPSARPRPRTEGP